jgi:hypothetical protein
MDFAAEPLIGAFPLPGDSDSDDELSQLKSELDSVKLRLDLSKQHRKTSLRGQLEQAQASLRTLKKEEDISTRRERKLQSEAHPKSKVKDVRPIDKAVKVKAHHKDLIDNDTKPSKSGRGARTLSR